MSGLDIVPQGTNYSFSVKLSGANLSAFTYTLKAKQYTGDTAAIDRVVTVSNDGDVDITLTPAETASLAIGLWYLIVEAIDSDEEIHATKRIHISENWV